LSRHDDRRLPDRSSEGARPGDAPHGPAEVTPGPAKAGRYQEWLEALERRHLADLSTREVARALGALSSCYVERRDKLAEGGALSSAGKRAAFALFYGPQHFLITQLIVGALPAAAAGIDEIVDLGCGTGGAGAAWAVASGARTIRGVDLNPWAVEEANWTYRQFALSGRAARANLAIGGGAAARRALQAAGRGTGVLAAYAVNELSSEGRGPLLAALLDAHRRGARVLVIEPIARRLGGISGWWDSWRSAFSELGGRADEWRFPANLPPPLLALARAAGLDPRELTARSLFV
jgi:hypothetical protein